MKSTLSDSSTPSNPEKGTRLRVIQGNFLEQDHADALAFFMPEDLSWNGRINAKILEKVGEHLDSYVLDHMIKPRRGDVFVVPEEISVQPRLIIGVLPKWDGGMDDEERALKKCLRGLVEAAESEAVTSLAIPALGMENKDYPARKAARIMMGILSSFSYRTLTDVRIVCKTAEMFQAYSQ